MSRKSWDKEKAIAMRETGGTVEQIAEAVGVSNASIYMLFKSIGAPTAPAPEACAEAAPVKPAPPKKTGTPLTLVDILTVLNSETVSCASELLIMGKPIYHADISVTSEGAGTITSVNLS